MWLAVHPLRGKPFRGVAALQEANDEDREERATTIVGDPGIVLRESPACSAKSFWKSLSTIPPTEASWSPPAGDPPPLGTATLFTHRSQRPGRKTHDLGDGGTTHRGGRAEIFARYAARHRTAATYLLPRLMGFAVDGSEADFRAVGQRMPFVRLATRD